MPASCQKRGSITRSIVAGALVIVAAVALVLGQTGNPEIGTWKLNIRRSTFISGTGSKSAISTIEKVGDDAVKHTENSEDADGTLRTYEYIVKYDGHDVPVMGNSPWGDTVALSLLDANTTGTVYKNQGQVTVVLMSVVSNDGKTRTVTTKGVTPAGKPVNNVSVYDRQ